MPNLLSFLDLMKHGTILTKKADFPLMILVVFHSKTSRDTNFSELSYEITASSSSYFGFSENAVQKLAPCPEAEI